MDGHDIQDRAPIIEIAPVTRAGMRLLTLLFGLSETGKTLSALKLAAGIEPNPAKRGLLDTEGGQRGRAYVDHIEGGYLYASLTPPFTPERYVEALLAFERAGVTVLVTDSVSHAWFAEGGVLDMVENATERNDMAKWAKPKRRLGKMQRRWLSSDVHMILCARAKQPLIESMVDGRKVLTPGPVVPVFEKSLRYDMTIIAQMLGDGQFTIDKPAGKCPGILRPIFAANPVMNEEMGRALAEWVRAEGGKTAAQRGLERDAMEAAEAGVAAFRGFWAKLTIEQRAQINDQRPNYASVARAADEEAARVAEQQRQAGAPDLGDDPFPDDAPAGAPIIVAPAASTAVHPSPAPVEAPAATTTGATAAGPFWEQPSYEITPEPRGKGGKNWPAWVEAFGHRWDSAPSEDARLKLREDCAKWFDHVKIGIPARWPEIERRLVGKVAA